MNEEQINYMVADKIMGWKLWLERCGEYEYVCVQEPGEREPWMRTRDHAQAKARYSAMTFADIDPMTHVVSDRLATYSPATDIAAAWLVAEKVGISVVLTADGWYALKASDVEHQIAALRVFGDRGKAQESAPLAIALAALRAVGVEVTNAE